MGLLGLKLPSSLVYLEKTFHLNFLWGDFTSAFMPYIYNENKNFEERKQMKERSSLFSIEFIGKGNLCILSALTFYFTLHIKPKSCNIMNI